MKLVLASIEDSLTQAWRKYCGDLEFVDIHEGSILEVKCDAVVSPANSFGFMDGGIDLRYMHYFSGDIQTRVRRQILDCHAGELIVGNADIVETDDDRIPFMILAPTMRVPMVLRDSVNAYLAARAILLLVKDGNFLAGPYQGDRVADFVSTIAVPGLGTGVGRLGHETCAKQVRAAIDDISLGQFRMPQHWTEASERHQLMYGDRAVDLQR